MSQNGRKRDMWNFGLENWSYDVIWKIMVFLSQSSSRCDIVKRKKLQSRKFQASISILARLYVVAKWMQCNFINCVLSRRFLIESISETIIGSKHPYRSWLQWWCRINLFVSSGERERPSFIYETTHVLVLHFFTFQWIRIYSLNFAPNQRSAINTNLQICITFMYELVDLQPLRVLNLKFSFQRCHWKL